MVKRVFAILPLSCFFSMGIQFSPEMMSGIFNYVGDIFSDLKLPVLFLIGIFVGFFILEGILDGIAIRREKQEAREQEAREELFEEA